MNQIQTEIPEGRPLKFIPSPPGHLFLGNIQEVRKNPLRTLVEYSREIGDIIRIRLGPRTLFFINHPDYIKHILQDNYSNYSKLTRGWNKLRPLFGDGLLTSYGPKWLQQRKTMQPAFHLQRIKNFVSVFIDETNALVESWRPLAKNGKLIDVSEEMMGLTFRIVTKTLFSEDLGNEVDTVYWALTQILHCASEGYYRLIDFPLWVPIPRNHRARAGLQALDKIVYDLIEQRRQRGSSQSDLLSMLMEVKDPDTDKRMTDEEIRDQVMTIFMTGHETTAVALTWTWYLLSKFPEATRKLGLELDNVLNGKAPSLESLSELTYTRRVFKEALRLYPPIWVFSRRTSNEDRLGDYVVPAGSTIFMSPYVMHRNPDFFKNPEGFDPERFTSDKIGPPPPFIYMPFGGGPRICIGREFASMEAQIIISILAQHFKLNLLPGHPVEEAPSITLRPKYGMLMTLEEK
jgi:cytochrome P450